MKDFANTAEIKKENHLLVKQCSKTVGIIWTVLCGSFKRHIGVAWKFTTKLVPCTLWSLKPGICRFLLRLQTDSWILTNILHHLRFLHLLFNIFTAHSITLLLRIRYPFLTTPKAPEPRSSAILRYARGISGHWRLKPVCGGTTRSAPDS